MRKALMVVLLVLTVAAGGWVAWALLRPARQVAATVTCGDAELFQSDLGIINIAQMSLGQYLYVDTAQHVAFHGGFLISEEPVVTEPMASLNMQYEASLSVSISADVPAVVQAQAEEAISQSTRLVASGVRRGTMASVLRALEGDLDASDEIQRVVSRGEAIPFVVHTVVTADSVSIGLAGTAEGSMETRLVVDKFELAVRYDCSQALDISGSQVAVFFKVTPIGYDEAVGFFVDTRVDVDFTKVRMAQTLR